MQRLRTHHLAGVSGHSTFLLIDPIARITHGVAPGVYYKLAVCLHIAGLQALCAESPAQSEHYVQRRGRTVELLVVTLAQASQAREVDALARMRVIAETVRNAPGLLNARFYQSREPGHACCILTTWESSEWWQKAQERYAPRTLLLDSPQGIFHMPPDQWLMQYLWGYSRPLARPAVAAAQLALVRPEMAEQVQQQWLESLRQQAQEPLLSFALFAHSIEEELTARPPDGVPPAEQAGHHFRFSPNQGTIFFTLLSWSGEQHREDFYSDQTYQHIQGLLKRTGIVHTFTLDPL
jgi:quinol monooxygenase YgiN